MTSQKLGLNAPPPRLDPMPYILYNSVTKSLTPSPNLCDIIYECSLHVDLGPGLRQAQ